MESLLKDFEIESKNPAAEQLQRWRSAVGVVKNPRRRFRMVQDLVKRSEAELKKRTIQGNIRVALYTQKAAWQFIAGISAIGESEYQKEEHATSVVQAGFDIDPGLIASVVFNHNYRRLTLIGGVEGVASKLLVSMVEGVSEDSISTRQQIYGLNHYAEKRSKTFHMFVWESLQDSTLIVLLFCSVVLIGLGIATEGWPEGVYGKLGIILSIFVVVVVTAFSDYQQSLRFREWDKENKKKFVQVTRDGNRQKISTYDLVVGDIVHLSTGDQVPADGVYISGYGLLIDESNLSGEAEAINVCEKNPFILSGTKVLGGSGKMLVTTVGIRTEWMKFEDVLDKVGEEETPLQVKLNGLATIVGKVGLTFALLILVVLTIRFVVEKALHGEFNNWSSNDAMKLLNYFAIVVAMVVVAVPEGLPLAVTLNLAFAVKRLMKGRALVRHLSACEAMGSASCICVDKTGTLTTNHMVVDKIWICGKAVELKSNESGEKLKTEISEGVLSILLQAIFQNTASEMVKNKHGKSTILGTPTESALLELGLLLGGDFDSQRRLYKICKVEPFNSVQKKMSVVVSLPNGGVRAFCKGAAEIILQMCDKIIDSNGKPVDLFGELAQNISNVINGFASEALRTLCLAVKDINEIPRETSIPDNGYTLIAIVGIKDPVRPAVKDAVQTCLAAGVTVPMVTGDNIYTARAIAKECGILTEGGVAIGGPEFRNWSQWEKKDIIPRIQVMARSLPLDKHILVSNLRNMFGKVVVVIGDGTNDAPALYEADIGLAKGIAGTEIVKENADIIILDDNFETIVNVIKWGRALLINIKKLVQFQLTVILVALLINFVSACIAAYVPLTAVQLLWVNLIMDILYPLALVTEPLNDGIMKRPPIRKGENFITKAMWRNIIGQSVYQLIVLAVLNLDGKRILRISGSNATDVLNTFIFNSFIFFQVFNEINCREIEMINIFRGILDGWIFLAIIFSTVAIQVIIVQFLGIFASTVPLNWELWLLSVLIGATSMLVAALMKCIPVERDMSIYHEGYEALPTGP